MFVELQTIFLIEFNFNISIFRIFYKYNKINNSINSIIQFNIKRYSTLKINHLFLENIIN